jgi:hypothetical protein
VTRPSPKAALLLVCAAICAALIGGCGEQTESASSAGTLDETVAATAKIKSARLTASLDIEPDGLIALGGPIKLRASGPFAAPAAGELPRAKLAIVASLGGQALHAGATSTGKRLFVSLDGRAYEARDEAVSALSDAFGGKGGGFASLGLDPAAWIEHLRDDGEVTVGGVRSDTFSGTIDVEKLLADVAGLLGGGGAGSFLTPKLRAKIADAVTSAKVDFWVGKTDRILRQLTLAIDFAFKQGASPLQGLDGGKIKLRLLLDGVNATEVEVSAPKHPRPLSDLLQDRGLTGLLSGLGAGLPRGAGAGDGGQALLKCLRAAGENSEAVKRCASKLGP